MKKSKSVFLGILASVFIIISIIYFVTPVSKGIPFLVAYASELLMFCLIGYIVTRILEVDQNKNGFLWYGSVKIIVICIVIETILALFGLLTPDFPSWLMIVASIVLLGVAVISVMTVAGGKRWADYLDQKNETQTMFISTIRTEIKILADNEKDAATKKKLSRLFDKVKYSDPRSVESLFPLEQQILTKINSLKMATDKQKAIQEIEELLDDRNTRCKALK